ncbi:MAG TPA: potassium-transporting ATPase subunit KdpC [Syntrophorhabdaceae bacterium]|nr:potassium-transporting ATPase subunit KdpC [Syntrophorhabdaceae bacterium]
MKSLLSQLRTSVVISVCLLLLVCGLYPAIVWIVAQIVFPYQANGSLVRSGEKIVGSYLIGQKFEGPMYFHPRPSAAGNGYDARSSGGSNLGTISKNLIETIKKRAADYRQENGLLPYAVIPADAVTASASGLDPHISPENAFLQANRVAKARNVGEGTVIREILSNTEGPDLWIFGEKRINVLKLNMALDELAGKLQSMSTGG